MSVDELDDTENEGLRRVSSHSSEDEPEKDATDPASEPDSEPEDEVPSAKGRKVSERHRVQTAQFKSWYASWHVTSRRCSHKHRFNKRVEHISKEDDKKLRSQLAEDAQSKSVLIAKLESNNIINDPREYQLELFERAKTQNTIAVLDTGKYPRDHGHIKLTFPRFRENPDSGSPVEIYSRSRAGASWAWQAAENCILPGTTRISK